MLSTPVRAMLLPMKKLALLTLLVAFSAPAFAAGHHHHHAKKVKVHHHHQKIHNGTPNHHPA